jgi:hypothetical protein
MEDLAGEAVAVVSWIVYHISKLRTGALGAARLFALMALVEQN